MTTTVLQTPGRGSPRRRAVSPGALGVVLSLSLVLAAACISNTDRGEWARGNVLQINVSNVQRVSEVPYSAGGQHYIILPKDPGASLVVAKVLLRNDKSAQVSLLVDQNAAYLANRQLNRHGIVDPYTQRSELAEPPSDGAKFLPLLWNVVEVPQGFQIEGWVVFEIPEDFEVYQFNWEQADTIRVPLEGKL